MRSKNPELFIQIEEFLNEYISKNGNSPTISEVSKYINLGKTATFNYLHTMKDMGIIDFEERMKNITTQKTRQIKAGCITIPRYNKIACGEPITASSDVVEYVNFPTVLLGSPKDDYFMLTAKGDSMIDVGIDDGDVIVVKAQNTADNGQIVVACIDCEEATLKRFYLEGQTVRLHPENEKLDDLIYEPSRVYIQGVAIRVIKKL